MKKKLKTTVLNKLLNCTYESARKDAVIEELQRSIIEASVGGGGTDVNLFDAGTITSLLENRKIEALKRHRERTGKGLQEAKNAIWGLYQHLADKGLVPNKEDI